MSTLDELEDRARTYSRRYPVGSPCRYWEGKRTGPGVPSTIRSRFWVLGHGEIVCQVEGAYGGVPLAMLQLENLGTNKLQVEGCRFRCISREMMQERRMR